jgi:hypothetical protein
MLEESSPLVNQPHAFKHRDVVRIVKAARAAGVDVEQVTVDARTGTITVGPGRSEAPSNDLDNWLKKKDAHPT